MANILIETKYVGDRGDHEITTLKTFRYFATAVRAFELHAERVGLVPWVGELPVDETGTLRRFAGANNHNLAVYVTEDNVQ